MGGLAAVAKRSNLPRAESWSAGSSCPISTNDAVQALLFTLISDMRGRPLVPTSREVATINAGAAQCNAACPWAVTGRGILG